MIRAHAVETVREAEARAMAGLPEGELMQRAARGLAEVAAARLEDVDGSTVVGLVGSGDNGGDTLYAVAHLAESGFPCAVVVVAAGGRDALRQDGARGGRGRAAPSCTSLPTTRHAAARSSPRPTSCSTASSASVDGRGCSRLRPGSSTPSTTTPG